MGTNIGLPTNAGGISNINKKPGVGVAGLCRYGVNKDTTEVFNGSLPLLCGARKPSRASLPGCPLRGVNPLSVAQREARRSLRRASSLLTLLVALAALACDHLAAAVRTLGRAFARRVRFSWHEAPPFLPCTRPQRSRLPVVRCTSWPSQPTLHQRRWPHTPPSRPAPHSAGPP